MTTLADKSLLSGGDNKPPMLEKHLYDSWKSRMELYMLNRPHGRMILASVEKGPLVWPSITEDGFVDTVESWKLLCDCGNGLVIQEEVLIVCHEKVVRISLEGDEILQVQGECTQGVAKTLLNTKVVPGATPVAKSPYRLAPSEMQEWSEQLQELQDKVVKDKILATSSETPKVENAPTEMLYDMDQQMERGQMMVSTLWIKLYSEYEYEIRYHPGKANVVTDALSRKERVKPRRVPLVGSEMDEAHASSLRYLSENEIESPWILSLNCQDAAESVRDAIGFEYCLASSSGWTK
ncbi:hypothetical protein Tco_0261840 [Tanacetum coccineum]